MVGKGLATLPVSASVGPSPFLQGAFNPGEGGGRPCVSHSQDAVQEFGISHFSVRLGSLEEPLVQPVARDVPHISVCSGRGQSEADR